MYIALEWAVENNSQLILSDARVQLVIEVTKPSKKEKKIGSLTQYIY